MLMDRSSYWIYKIQTISDVLIVSGVYYQNEEQKSKLYQALNVDWKQTPQMQSRIGHKQLRHRHNRMVHGAPAHVEGHHKENTYVDASSQRHKHLVNAMNTNNTKGTPYTVTLQRQSMTKDIN
eukprot:810177_1